jgi:hypothetical protein
VAAWIIEIGSIFAMEIATLGTLQVTLGGVAAVGLLAGLTIKIFKRVFGR